jgi:hypothetical protein
VAIVARLTGNGVAKGDAEALQRLRKAPEQGGSQAWYRRLERGDSGRILEHEARIDARIVPAHGEE